ncbi:MAG: membrane protein insertion efficiency factor YidD [Verrucomicrobiales bacterium]
MNPVRFIFVVLIKSYRLILSPLKNLVFGPYSGCRFSPSCSAYALQAYQTHGVLRATCLTFCRLARCHPWGGSGYDPVPEKPSHCNNC